ncbi:MAG: homoserine dehydrogenase [Bacteroidia bacterium]|nr:homoserine dehydrogenase [Bacteroidia bacterium]
MSTNKNISIGLFGFGCVGQGLYDVLSNSQGLKASIDKICVKSKNKDRKVDMSFFTWDKNVILSEKKHDVIVELIDNADEAFAIVKEAIENGVSVVTANKKMLAENFETLYKLQEEHKVALIYEGSAGGSIPIIRNLEEYYDNELLTGIKGILNGTCNYILTRMELENKDYSEILKDAQAVGFAESDPWLDVAGFDTKYKLVLLTVHSFGIILKPDQVLNLGINTVSYDDILYAKRHGYRIKLIARAEKINDKVRVFVLPHFVPKDTDLYNTLYEYNAVEVEGAFSCKQTFTGKGAGAHPTGSAVLSDISALTYDYKYAYKKLKSLKNKFNGSYEALHLLDKDFTLKLYIRFKDKEELKELDIVDIEEEYKSAATNYIIANVKFNSLFNIYNKPENKLFVCVVE